MTFHIITLFPRAFDSYLGESILKRAIEDKKIKVKFYNPRDYTRDKHLRIDRKPYGGGPGMVIQALPVIRAIESAFHFIKRHSYIPRNVGMSEKKRGKYLMPSAYRLVPKIIWLTPSGEQFTNETGVKYAKCSDLIIICGRYEGIDARVKRAIHARHPSSAPSPFPPEDGSALGGKRGGKRWGGMPRIELEEVSVGPFVLTGGELPAMLMIDVISRQIPGVLGNEHSREETRVASPEVYTRPDVFSYRGKNYRVPKILLSGHHAQIDKWRKSKKG